MAGKPAAPDFARPAMAPRDQRALRLSLQGIASGRFSDPESAVAGLGALQAQDWPGLLWSIGLRSRSGREEVERSVAGGRIVRAWLMRGTLHATSARDLRWLLALVAPRLIAASASRRRQLGLDHFRLERSRELVLDVLKGGKPLSRDSLNRRLEGEGLAATPQQKRHILFWLALSGVICFAAPQGAQSTLARLDDWVPPGRPLERPEALAELARRYFSSRGPATLADFGWWSGLTLAEARIGLEANSGRLFPVTVSGRECWMPKAPPDPPDRRPGALLLPGFDEYLLGYREREAALDPLHAERVCPGGNGMFKPTLVIDGKVAGTWRRLAGAGRVIVAIQPFAPLKKSEAGTVARAAEAYGRFLNLAVDCRF